jgi:hypothetical protein
MRQVSGQESLLKQEPAAICCTRDQKVFKWIRYFTDLIQVLNSEQNEPLIYQALCAYARSPNAA